MRALVLVALSFALACGGGQPPPEASTAPKPATTESAEKTDKPASPSGPTSTGSPNAETPSASAAATEADAGAPSSPMSASQLVGDAGAKLLEFKVAGSQPAIGERPRGETQPVLDANLKAVAQCYGTSVKRNPESRGRLNVKITVEPDGKVSSAVDAGGSSVTDTTLVGCVLGTYKKLRFSKVPTKAGSVPGASRPREKDVAVHAVFFGPDAV